MGMHQVDAVVLVGLVLASIVAMKLAPAMSLVLLATLVRYRRAVSKNA
jgi:hypothetical protein